MKIITAQANQTVFDIALQETGSYDGVFEILKANAFLRIDMALEAGQIVFVPDTVIKPNVVDYFTRNNIKPVTGLGETISLTPDEMINIKQTLAYNLTAGNHVFDGTWIANMGDKITIQVNYHDIVSDTIMISLEQSLDGIAFAGIDNANAFLDKNAQVLTFNLQDLLTNYIRLRVTCANNTVGVLDNVIFRV